MISANQIVKFGRKNKILEFTDNLAVNNFYEETGYKNSTLHGRFSKIQVALIDITKGKKERAQVGGYNIDADMVPKLLKEVFTESFFRTQPCLGRKVLMDGIDSIENMYKQRSMIFNAKYKDNTNDFLSGFKINKYVQLDGGYCPTSNITLSFERPLAEKGSSPWKITFDMGKCIPESDGKLTYPKKGSYVKTFQVMFFLSHIELQDTAELIGQSYSSFLSYAHMEMAKYREEFMKRYKANNYDDANVAKWNSNPNDKRKNQKNRDNAAGNGQGQKNQGNQNQNRSGNVNAQNSQKNQGNQKQNQSGNVNAQNSQRNQGNQNQNRSGNVNAQNSQRNQSNQNQNQPGNVNAQNSQRNQGNQKQNQSGNVNAQNVQRNQGNQNHNQSGNVNSLDGLICQDCGKSISATIRDYSLNKLKLGGAYCMACQQKHRKKA